MRLLPAALAAGLFVLLPLADAAQSKKKKPRLKPAEGSLPLEWVDGLKWRSIGPANMGGRITDVAVNPADPCMYYLAHASAGVLKTSNNGVDYEHLFTDQGTGSVGALGLAPSNPDVLYVGTGEPNPRNSVSWGDGVYKTEDGGETWQHLGLDETFQIGAIVVHPEDADTVYVAALGRLWGPNEERGLFKSTDGGKSWDKVLYVDDQTGVIDVTLHPTNPDVVLAATYERQRDRYDSNDPAKKWGAGSGLWRSSDAGETWTRLEDGEGAGKGLPAVKFGRIGLDWARAEENTVFAIIETELGTQARPDSAYMGVTSEDAGIGVRIEEVTEDSPAAAAGLLAEDVIVRLGERLIVDREDLTEEIRLSARDQTVNVEVVRDGEPKTLELTYSAPPEEEEDRTDELGYPRAGPYSLGLGGQRANQQHLQGPTGKDFGGVYRSDDGGDSWTRVNSLNPRPMYYSQLRVDPSDTDNVYVLGTRLWRSFDGGETFNPDGHGNDVHVDHHALWIDPRDGRHMILGNDGGIYITWDQMESWDHHNHVAIGQFYNVGVDATRDYKAYGGLQDNGSWGGPNRTPSGGPTNTDWFRVGGGDGFVVLVDPTDPDLIYYESQNGGMGRWHLSTGERGFMRPRAPRGQRYRFNWNTPFLLSAHNPKIYYAAGNHVFRSLDRGEGLRRISPKVTTTDRGSATALSESPSDPDRLYVGTDDGGVWTTEDGGVTWTDLWTLNGAPEEEAEPEPEGAKAATVSRPLVDDLTGTWNAKAEGPGIESEQQGQFTLKLVLGDDGAVTGSLDSQVGNGPLKDGRFDAKAGRLRFAFEGNDLRLDFTASLKDDGSLAGEINGAGGAFRFDFTAQREAAEEPVAEAAEVTEEEPAEASEEAEDAPKKRKKQLKDTLDQLLPQRLYVSELVASRHRRERVYATFDGHRSNDDLPHVYVSEDGGKSWDSLRGNLPDHAGSARALAEDEENPDLLFLGTEFGCYASLDRGQSWTRINGNQLPNVPIHDFALSEAADELVVGTHGRSLWVLELAALRHITPERTDADAYLYPPAPAVQWRSAPTPGSAGTRVFRGENPSSGAVISYSLDKKAREISLTVQRMDGSVVRELEVSGEKGLHRVNWNLRAGSSGGSTRGRRRGGSRTGPGTYRVVLEVHGETLVQELQVRVDPNHPDPAWIAFEEAAELLEAELDGEEGEDQAPQRRDL